MSQWAQVFGFGLDVSSEAVRIVASFVNAARAAQGANLMGHESRQRSLHQGLFFTFAIPLSLPVFWCTAEWTMPYNAQSHSTEEWAEMGSTMSTLAQLALGLMDLVGAWAQRDDASRLSKGHRTSSCAAIDAKPSWS